MIPLFFYDVNRRCFCRHQSPDDNMLLRVFTAVLFLLALSPGVTAEDIAYPDSIQVRLLGSVQDDLYCNRYAAADSVARQLIELYPNDPAGYLFRAIGMVTEMFDAEENLYEAEFRVLIDTVEVLAAPGVSEADPRRRAWLYLYLGHARSYRALWESRFGSMVTALKKARDGSGDYKRGLEADSTVHDLYFGLGLYHYWKSAKAGVLRWVGLIRNDRDRGIRQLQLAADSSLISRQAARAALIWILIDRKEYEQAYALAETMQAEYKRGWTFLWPMAQIRFRQKDYRCAADLFATLRRHIAQKPGNYYNLIECDYHLAYALDRLEMIDSSRTAASAAQAYAVKIPKSTRHRQRDHLCYLARRAQ